MTKTIKWLAPALIVLAAGGLYWKWQHRAEPASHQQSEKAASIHYETYENGRFPFSLPFPKGLLIPGEGSDNGDGMTFTSPDQQTVMTAFGANNAAEHTLQDEYRGTLKRQAESGEPRQVTFKAIKKNWYVVSGTEGDKIFYQKTYLADDQFMTFRIRYPASQRAQWDPIVAHVSGKFAVTPGGTQ